MRLTTPSRPSRRTLRSMASRLPKQARRLPDRARVERLARDGRRRADALRESIPDEARQAPAQALHVVQELKEQVEPIVDRALHRRRSRGRARWVIGLLALVAIGVAAYMIWRRDDEEPAFLEDEPTPDITPAAPFAPTDRGPVAPSEPEDAPSASPSSSPAASAYREAVGARGSAESGASFTAARDLLPGRGDLGLPRFPH